ncbi:MAG: flagellin [Alphaproteobacteria bacterium]|nr:flagellin [Alphaproteobacteria bacterium]
MRVSHSETRTTSMADIKLSSSTRANLLSLNNTKSLLDKTSGRLATGLKVASAVDNAPAFFAAQALTNRANDFTSGLSAIEQGLNALQSALSGLTAITKLVEQLQGTLTSLLNASTPGSSASLTADYNKILGQIDALANDTSYQGANLINNSSQTLNFSFGGLGSAVGLTISAYRNDSLGLGLTTVATNLFFAFTTTLDSTPSRASTASVAAISSIASFASIAGVAAQGSVDSVASSASIASSASVNSVAETSPGAGNSIPSAASRPSIASVASVASRESIAAVSSAPSTGTTASTPSRASAASTASLNSRADVTVPGVNTPLVSSRQTLVSNALAKLRADSASLGSQNAILTVRLDFAKSYTANLKAGSDQLTLADLNEESANLTSLQTRQQLGVVSLSITAQSEQSILRLF